MQDISNKIIEEDLAYIASVDLPWEKFNGQSVLISGASGALASYMVETLLCLNNDRLENPVKIYALVRSLSRAQKRFAKYRNDKNLQFIEQDVCDKLEMTEKLDYIIHAASQASPKFYGKDPVGTLLPNVLGTYNLLKLATEKKIKGFLFFSAGAVYGQGVSGSGLKTETDFGSLDNLTIGACYPESKRMGETMCLAWQEQFGVPIHIVRPFHTYGPGFQLDDGRVFTDFIKNVINNENIVLSSDGKAERPFCYLADATVGFFTVLLKGLPGEAYNVSAEMEISIKAFGETLISIYPEKKIELICDMEKNADHIATAVAKYSPSSRKLRELGWKENYRLSEGLKRTVQFYLNNK